MLALVYHGPGQKSLDERSKPVVRSPTDAVVRITRTTICGTDLHLERLWSHNITITTRLVDTVSIPMLLKTVQSGRIDAKQLITHHFKLSDILQAYDTFGRAADTKALKVIIEA